MLFITKLINTIEKLARTNFNNYSADKSEKMLKWYIRKFILLNRAIKNKNQLIYRGEIYWCDLGENVGSEECKNRPCVIIQNQKGNEKSPTTIVAPITNATIQLPIAVPLNRGVGSPITGTVDLAQIRVVSKGRLYKKIDRLKTSELKAVDLALMRSLGLYRFVLSQQESDEKIRQLSNELNRCKKLLSQQNNPSID